MVGMLLGLLGAGAMAFYVPVVDAHRERSLITVQPNGGNVEEFMINLPRDRILVGLPNVENSIPAGLEWPGRVYLGDMQAEIFKIRNREDTVIGVGSRLASSSEKTGPFIEWSLYFPARGSIYVQLEVTPSADGVREGVMLSGTGDFARLSGALRERFIAGVTEDSAIEDRIKLEAMLVGRLEDVQ